jgi:UDP-2,3-diacylglucosamine pyrophosphatase LpxH
MLVCLSDLHFQDVSLEPEIKRGHNTQADAYRAFFRKIEAEANEHGAKEIVLLLNGDIFDLLRSDRWFLGRDRPFDEVLPEARLLEIFDKTVECNREALAAFREFSARARVVYVPGNHDRFVGAVPRLRERVAQEIGVQGRFPCAATFPEYGVFARHGHEYDWQNCEYNFEYRANKAKKLVPELYDRPCIGDWYSVEVASALPVTFKRLFSGRGLFDEIYPRLLEIDDVRPSSAVLAWVKETVARSETSWKMIRETIAAVLDAALASPFLERWIREHDRPWALDRVDHLQFLMGTVGKHLRRLPDLVVKNVFESLAGKEDRAPWQKAAKDPEFRKSGMRYLVHGHYHDSSIDFLGSGRVVICTGSWRRKHHLCKDRKTFYKGRSLNYAVFYREGERPSRGGHSAAFDFWQGFSKEEVTGG